MRTDLIDCVIFDDINVYELGRSLKTTTFRRRGGRNEAESSRVDAGSGGVLLTQGSMIVSIDLGVVVQGEVRAETSLKSIIKLGETSAIEQRDHHVLRP